MKTKTWEKRNAPEIVVTIEVAGERTNVWKTLAWNEKEIEEVKQRVNDAVQQSKCWQGD